MNNSQKILTLMNLARKQDPHPFARLERGKPIAKGREAVAGLSEKSKKADDPKTLLLQSAFYICFDCFEEAHNIAQDHEGPIGNWLHAILHRREPDGGNAKYWYARVKLPDKVNQRIVEEALKLLKSVSLPELEPLQRKISKSGAWEPEDFVDLCDKFRQKDSGSLAYWTLAKIQEIEWWGLVEFILTT
jgi:hypothetical protein